MKKAWRRHVRPNRVALIERAETAITQSINVSYSTLNNWTVINMHVLSYLKINIQKNRKGNLYVTFFAVQALLQQFSLKLLDLRPV